MDTYKELRARGFHSLAAVYKIKRKFFNDDCHLNDAETYILMRGPVLSYRDMDSIIERVHVSEPPLDIDILFVLNRISKEALKNPAGWRFMSNWQWHKELINGLRINEAREWFSHIATANSDNEWGKRAAKIVALIDRHLES